jgi:hypothetical protein
MVVNTPKEVDLSSLLMRLEVDVSSSGPLNNRVVNIQGCNDSQGNQSEFAPKNLRCPSEFTTDHLSNRSKL